MDALWNDVRIAARSLVKQPSVTIVAVLCLALGIGANTAIFSVVRSVLLNDLPYREPERLVRVYETYTAQGHAGLQGSVATLNFKDWREQVRELTDLAAYTTASRNVIGGPEPERIRVALGSANLFTTLGARPIVGHTFRDGDDAIGAAPVVVLSEGFWRRHFGGDSSAVGKKLLIDDVPHEILGVMPREFDFPISATHYDVWVPLPLPLTGPNTQRGSHWFSVVARLRPGATLDQAVKDMQTITAGLEKQYPGPMTGRSAMVLPMNDVVVGGVRPALRLLLGAVACVLLIACANVANLLLARGAARQHEIALRRALGADATHIVRQVLTESLLLALAGGALGIAFAFLSLRAILRVAVIVLPRADAIGLDGRVLLFTLGVSIATGLLFGMLPAWRARGVDLRQAIQSATGKASGGVGHRRLLKSLVVAEMAISLVLLAGAGLLVRSFLTVATRDTGLKPEYVLTFHTQVPAARVPDSLLYERFYGPVLAKLRASPGVRAAAIINMLPLQSWGMNGNFTIVGRPQESDPSRQPYAEFRVVSSDYFQTMGIPVVRGREFTDRDVDGTAPAVVVNEQFAKRYFPNGDAIGQRLFPWINHEAEIVGIVRGVRQAGLDQDAKGEIYVAAAENPFRLREMTFTVAGTASADALTKLVHEAVRAVDPDQPIYALKAMDQIVSESTRARQLTLMLLGALALLAIVLATAGMYGVMAYGVVQRTRELGIRHALGASGRQLTGLVMRETAVVTGLGVAIGLVAALAAAKVMQSLVFQVGTRDPLTFVLAPAVMIAMAFLASAIPAWRAAKADPLMAIRAE